MLDSEIIDDDTFDYLNVSKTRPGRFYILYKIHKTGILGRPIYAVITNNLLNASANLWTTTFKNILEPYPPISGTPNISLKSEKIG